MRIVFISDTHGAHDRIDLPDADVLVHCGDFTNRGRSEEISVFNEWLGRQHHDVKIVVPGNHDLAFESKPTRSKALLTHADHVLIDESVVVSGIKFFGSPRTPQFGGWAFMYDRRGPSPWDRIPVDTDVLITHGPAYDILDAAGSGHRCGCEALNIAVTEISPKVHAFGHIHESRGVKQVGETLRVNAAHGGGTYGSKLGEFHGWVVDL
jgi:Icc-related predicted phosphoesterase